MNLKYVQIIENDGNIKRTGFVLKLVTKISAEDEIDVIESYCTSNNDRIKELKYLNHSDLLMIKNAIDNYITGKCIKY